MMEHMLFSLVWFREGQNAGPMRVVLLLGNQRKVYWGHDIILAVLFSTIFYMSEVLCF